MKYKNNLDVLKNGTDAERTLILESFMYFLQHYKPHRSLIEEWLQKEPKTNCYGKIIL